MTECISCGGTVHDQVAAAGEWTYVACRSCGLCRIDPFPTEADSLSLYGDEYFTEAANAGYDDYVADESVHRRNARARLGRLGPAPRPGARLVDVGCAFGFTMVEATAAGWDPLGVEVNATARRAVHDEGMRCEATLDDLQLDDGSIDAVTFFQSLEHLSDPLAALVEARRCLSADGTVLIETWDRSSRTARVFGDRWQQLSPPSVLWLFDEPSLDSLAASAGLRLESWRRSTKWVTLGLVVGQVAEGTGTATRMLRRARALPLPYFLGDLVTVRLRPA